MTRSVNAAHSGREGHKQAEGSASIWGAHGVFDLCERPLVSSGPLWTSPTGKNLKQNEAQSPCAESTHEGVNWYLKYVAQAQQQRPELLKVTVTWQACKYEVHKLLKRMYLWWSLCTLHLHACQVRVTVGDSGLCCTCVTYFEHQLTPLCVDSFPTGTSKVRKAKLNNNNNKE